MSSPSDPIDSTAGGHAPTPSADSREREPSLRAAARSLATELLALAGAIERREQLAPGDLAAIRGIAAAADARERAWAIEERRHARRVKLEALLPKIAESLDVRHVFVQLSGLIRDV